MSSITEALVEKTSTDWVVGVGAMVLAGTEIDDAGERRDSSQVTLQGRLAAALHRLNSSLPHDSLEEVVRILSRPPHPTLIQNNRWFHAQLTDGVEIEYCLPAEASAQAGDAKSEDCSRRAISERPSRRLQPCHRRLHCALH